MALFDVGILPDNGEHARIFEELYGCRLITMRKFPKSLARAVACRKSWEGEVNRGRSNPSLQELVQYGKMLYSALKEASERARVAAMAEKLTFEEFTESTAKKLDEDERSWVLVECMQRVVVEMYRYVGIVALGKLEPLEVGSNSLTVLIYADLEQDVLNIGRAMPPSPYYGHIMGN